MVAVVAVGLAILWRRPNAHEDTAPGNRPSAREPQTSSQPEGASQAHTVNPVDLPVLGSQGEDGTEGSPCDRLAPAEYRSIPNGSRIMPDIGTNGYPRPQLRLIRQIHIFQESFGQFGDILRHSECDSTFQLLPFSKLIVQVRFNRCPSAETPTSRASASQCLGCGRRLPERTNAA